MRTLATVAAVLALWCAIVFWSASAFSQGAGGQPFLIGGSVAQSGLLGDLAREYVKGIELWRDDVNGRGGLAGRPVELRLFDDGSGARRAAEVAGVLLAEDKVDLLFGPFGSPAAMEVAVVADRARRIMINAAGAGPDIHRRSLRYVFQLPPPSDERALPALKLAQLLGVRTIALFAGAGAGSQLGRLRQEAAAAGIALVESGGLPVPAAKPPNYPPLLVKAGANTVLAVFEDVLRVVDLVREMKQAGFRPAALVSPGVAQPEFIKRVGVDAEYAFGMSAYEPLARTRGNAEFVRAFQARHKQPPDANAAAGWAAGQLLEAGVAAAGTLETEPLRDALAKLETETVLGAYRVDANGQQRAAATLLLQILKGRREVIAPDAYRSAEPVLTPPAWPKR